MRLRDHHPLIEDVLDAWSPSLGEARSAYRGHVYRVFNYARCLYGSESRDDDFAVTSVFHDLGIWSDRTFDYLSPSSARAAAYLAERGDGASTQLIVEAIENHHALLRVRTGTEPAVVEAFRRADRVDVSVGFLRADLEREFVLDVVRAFPYGGFHGVLLRTALAWFVRHPFRPLPMLKLSATPSEEIERRLSGA